MENMMSDSEIQNKIMLNEQALSKGKNAMNVFLYCMVMCVFNRYNPVEGKTVFVVNGKAEKKYEKQEAYETIYYSTTETKIYDYIFVKTHISNLKCVDRLMAIFKAIRCKSIMPIGYRIDYFLWKAFFQKTKIKKIANSGHYDRLSTQLSMLSDLNGVAYCMKQHGLLNSTLYVPCKLKVSELTVYDKYEQAKFQSRVVDNCDCKYIIEYKSSIDFCNSNKKGFSVGIIEQPLQQTKEILKTAKTYFNPEQITIMMHPLSNTEYINTEITGMNITYSKEKELSYDLILALSSTLVYEYLRNGYSKPIIVFDCLNCLTGIAREYKNVKICVSMEQFNEEVKSLAIERDDIIRSVK